MLTNLAGKSILEMADPSASERMYVKLKKKFSKVFNSNVLLKLIREHNV
jgi:hypothetical protein